jgi:gamma-glutamyltranspeptidase
MNDFSVTKYVFIFLYIDDRDSLNLFGLPPSVANRIAPGKRPLSSMSPTLVFDLQRGSRVALALGASGGPTIVSSVLQVMIDVLDLNLDPQVAVNLPRVHVQVGTEQVSMEQGLSYALQKGIISRGHILKIAPLLPDGHTIGCVQAIQVIDKIDGSTTLVAAADPRKIGRPATY